MGIKETSDLLKFLARLTGAIEKTLADGKVNLADVGYAFDPLLSVASAIQGIDQVDDEIADLDSEEGAQLVLLLEQELDLDNEVAEELSAEGLALAISLVLFVKKVQAARG